MKRASPFLLLLLPLMGACNPEGPTGPEAFFWADVFGLWKIRAETEGCLPDDVLNLQMSRFGGAIEGDSIQVGGTWFRDEENPQVFTLRGAFDVNTGETHLRLDQDATMVLDGLFISSRDFRGAYAETGRCVVRVRGRFIE